MLIGVYDEGADGLTLRGRFPVTVPADARAVVLPAGAVRPDPALLLPNDGDLSYCKVRLDPASRDALAACLGRLPDPLSRAVAWTSVRDLVRDGELAPREYLRLAARHLPAETESSLAGHVIGYARWTVADRYLPAGQRAAALADLTSLCRDLLSPHPAAHPGLHGGGELRLVAVRGLIDSASGPDDVSALTACADWVIERIS